MDEVGAPGRRTITWFLRRRAKQFFILLQILYFLCMCAVTTFFFHGIKERQSLEIASVQHVLVMCSG